MFLTDDGFHYDGTTPALSFTVRDGTRLVLVVLDYKSSLLTFPDDLRDLLCSTDTFRSLLKTFLLTEYFDLSVPAQRHNVLCMLWYRFAIKAQH